MKTQYTKKTEDLKIGQVIKIFRAAIGIRQKDLAKKVDIQPHYLSLIESGKREPSLQMLRRIAKELDVPIGLLFWEAEGKGDVQPSKQQHLLRNLRLMLLEMERLRLGERKAS